jgi:GMP reductase
MIQTKVLYSLDDVMIQPAAVTRIRHREDIKSVYDDEFLPIFTAPMPCVVNTNQYLAYIKPRINPIIPRTEKLETRLAFLEQMNIFVAFSLEEFIDLFLMNAYDIDKKAGRPIKVLIDIACGNMEALHNAIIDAKKIYADKLIIMSGNIANPQSFFKLALAGCDYIRCSVGSGSCCGTATYTGIYYPMASLLDECYKIKKYRTFNNKDIKIIADGGITRYRDAFKALALGADYVMMGSRLCQCEDSAGEIINKEETLTRRENKRKLYFGMASEMGSQLLGKDTSAPEGMVKEYPILEPIAKFADKFSNYLASTMSYCNAHNLYEFIGKQTLNVISNNAAKQFNQ